MRQLLKLRTFVEVQPPNIEVMVLKPPNLSP